MLNLSPPELGLIVDAVCWILIWLSGVCFGRVYQIKQYRI